MKFFITMLLALLFTSGALAAGTITNILNINTATTNVTTSAFVQLSSSTPIAATELSIMNGTSSVIIVATGASGSEVGLVAVLPASQTNIVLGKALPSGTRVSLEALDATASSKFVSVSLLP